MERRASAYSERRESNAAGASIAGAKLVRLRGAAVDSAPPDDSPPGALRSTVGGGGATEVGKCGTRSTGAVAGRAAVVRISRSAEDGSEVVPRHGYGLRELWGGEVG